MDWILIVALGALLIFMFWSSRRRAARAKVEQEAKARAMVPGVKVLMQGGLYGTIVEYDSEDLSKAARIELAPGVEVEVHSQGILRVVDELEGTVTEDEFIEAEESEAEYVEGVMDGEITSISDDQAAARTRAAEAPAVDPEDKPQA